ncbi:CoA-binding protein [Salinispira pacifica]
MGRKATRTAIDDFLSERTLAVVGVSRNGRKFGNAVFDELKAKGFSVYPVNPHAERIGEETCYKSVSQLPPGVGGIVAVVPPQQTEAVVREAEAAGIRKIWMQRGAESDGALDYCAQHGMSAVSGECIMMFAEPVSSVHGVHRFFRRIFGGLPK